MTEVIFLPSKQNNQMDFPQEIAATYFQKINTGGGQVGTGNDFISSSKTA
jgi:hypothetical protein